MHFCQSVFRKLAVALLVLLLGGAMAPVLAQQLSFPADIHYVPWCPNCATNLGAGKWGSATVAAQRLAVGRDLSCGSPANNASSVTFDHVQQQFLGPQFYDSFFDGYWLFTPCRPGGLSGLYNSSILFTGLGGALRVYTCPAGMSLTTTVIGGTSQEGKCTPFAVDPAKNCGPSCTDCGNPINNATGNKFQQQTEYRGAGPFPLTFGWTYNSLDAIYANPLDDAVDPLGRRRRHSYQRQVVFASNSSVTAARVMRPDGKIFTFSLSGANTWAPEADVADRLIRLQDASANTTGWQYILQADDSTENFDANGRLTSIVMRSGLSQTLGYNTDGQLVSVTDDFGRGLGFSYDTLGRINTMTDPASGVTLFAYDASGNLATVTYPDMHSKGYLYNETGLVPAGTPQPYALTGITDENGARFATFTYGSSGVAISTEHAGGVEKYTVSISGNTSQVTDPLGTLRTTNVSTIIGVQKPNNVSQPCSTPGCGNVLKSTATTYDANGNVASTTDFLGNRSCHNFDLTRNLQTTRIDGLTSATSCATALAASSLAAPARRVDTTWHATYRLLLTVTEPAAGGGSKVTTNNYDAVGNVLSRTVATPAGTRTWSWTYDQYGRVLTATDPRALVTTNTYYANTSAQGNSRGMLASVQNAAGHVTTIDSYNAHGQPLTITDPNGLVTTMTYDFRQRLKTRSVGGETTNYNYYPTGLLQSVIMPDASTLTYSYDNAHRLTQILDGLGNKIIYTPDNMGNRIREDAIDSMGQLARRRAQLPDALNRMATSSRGVDNPPTSTPTDITDYTYDDNGNLKTANGPLVHDIVNGVDVASRHVTTNAYDALNRLQTVTSPPVAGVTISTGYNYDAQDNLTQVTDPKGLVTTYAYNGFNEMVTQTSPDTGVTTFTYDVNSKLATKTDARATGGSVTASYTYDALNRVATITYPGESVVTLYAYDSCTNGKGRLCGIADKTGTTTYSYDNHGRVLTKAQTVAGVTQTVGYHYNASGQMDNMTLPSGALVAYSYTNNRVTGMTVDGAPLVANADYEPFGPIDEWVWGNSTVANPNTHTRQFDTSGRLFEIDSGANIDPALIGYDVASRITALQRKTGTTVDPAKSATFGYDPLDRLDVVTPGAGNPAASQSFGYDQVGNRTSNTKAGASTIYYYGFTGTHRLSSLSGATSTTFGYDLAGNKTTDGVQTWSYGGDNRPTQVSLVTGGNTTNILVDINALGQRVRKTVPISGSPPDVTWFVYDEAGRLIGEYRADGSVVREHLWLNDLPVGVLK